MPRDRWRRLKLLALGVPGLSAALALGSPSSMAGPAPSGPPAPVAIEAQLSGDAAATKLVFTLSSTINPTVKTLEKPDRIVLDLNGGIKGGRRFLDHLQIGMGTQTTPINGAPTNAPGGTSVALIFGGPIGEVTSAEIKKMLQPILDFEKESVTANYVDTLPEPIKEAVKAKKAIEGMNHDQVLLAVGKPVHKSRETKEGTEYEDWIYGEPPGRVTFVTFTGDKVVKVKETYAGLGGSVAETPQQP